MYGVYIDFLLLTSYLQGCVLPCTSKHNHHHHKWQLALLSSIVATCSQLLCSHDIVATHVVALLLFENVSLQRDFSPDVRLLHDPMYDNIQNLQNQIQGQHYSCVVACSLVLQLFLKKQAQLFPEVCCNVGHDGRNKITYIFSWKKGKLGELPPTFI